MNEIHNHYQEFLGITDMPIRSAISTGEKHEKLYDITHLIKKRGHVPVVSSKFDRGVLWGLILTAAILAIGIISVQVLMAVYK